MRTDFSTWKKYDGANEGSGRSEKIWLRNPNDGQIGLFKYKKDIETKDHVSEKLASDIASILNLPCAKIEIGTYKDNEGSMSYLINAKNEMLIEGISFINQIYPNYNAQDMYDKSSNEYYSLEMIVNSIKEYGLLQDLLKMLVFDFLIGNSDRHQNNWALISAGDGKYRFSPLYDNSSSLCCYILEDKIPSYLGKDLNRLKSIVTTKSLSIVRLDKMQKKRPTHQAIFAYLWNRFECEIEEFVYLIKVKINANTIRDIVSSYDELLLSAERKKLISLFLLEKTKSLSNMIERKEE